MRILGIDPGTSLIGYGIVDNLGTTYKSVGYGECRTTPKIPNQDRVTIIYDFFDKLIKKNKPDVVAIEDLFFFKNAKTVIKVSEIRGVLLLVAMQNGIEVREFTPLQVKQSVTNYGKADKTQVGRMVQLILDLKEIPRPDDVADALAIAICGGSIRL